uniref:Uncharacterized mitochondrial protein AtMg00810-like n=1 Tax=Nicotiana tabacum TaxID=4097 RepID=A0A1S3Y3U7_TOBAC|nr:PREDICTED: uncharacterized mitochondrial protein AtMg00810-like [Nicotiana tabacum]
MVTMRVVVALAAASGWYAFQMDVHHAFLQGDILEEVYMQSKTDQTSQKGFAGEIQDERSWKYALELVSELGLAGAKPAATPLEFNHKLTSVEFDKQIPNGSFTIDEELEDKGVQVLSQYMYAPKVSHMEAAQRVMRYIKTAHGFELFMPAKVSKSLSAYCDSDWGACVESRRSMTGYAVKFGEAPISWK